MEKTRSPEFFGRVYTLTCIEICRMIPRLHDSLQSVVKPVEQPDECLFARCRRLFKWFDNRFYRVNGLPTDSNVLELDGYDLNLAVLRSSGLGYTSLDQGG